MTEATFIQLHGIPRILNGRNLIAQTLPGSGKTVAFTIGMISTVDTSVSRPQVLCLAPTRELANQIIADAVIKLSSRITKKGTSECAIKVAAAISQDSVDNRPARGSICDAHIVVGTPGTVSNWIRYRYLDLSHIKMFVLDEADYMIDQGVSMPSSKATGSFGTTLPPLGHQTVDILKQIQRAIGQRPIQYLFFSATFPEDVLRFTKVLFYYQHQY